MNTKDVEEMLETWYKSLPERPKSDTDLRVNKKELSELITTHRTQLLQEIEGEVLNETFDVLPPPDDAKDFMGDWERGVVTGGYSVKERVLTIIRNKQIP